MGLKRGRKGGSKPGAAICCRCCRCCCWKSWLKHPLLGWLWERGHARVPPSADFADSRWHLGFGDTSASPYQARHSLSRFCRGRCHAGCLRSPGSLPAPGRAEPRQHRSPARQSGGLPWAPASSCHTHTRCRPPRKASSVPGAAMCCAQFS